MDGYDKQTGTLNWTQIYIKIKRKRVLPWEWVLL
jgi:hypothetical protein